MSDELNEKPKFILNKKGESSSVKPANSAVAPAETAEKKKVIVVKKKTAIPPAGQNAATNGSASSSSAQPNHTAATAGTESEKKRPVSSIELSPPRPNIKQGNLADKPRQQGGGRREGSSGYQQSAPHRDGSSGYQQQPRREGGFTGAQAREGYNNRNVQQGEGERPRGNYNNNGGQGGQGGYNRPSGGQGGQGGYNRPSGGQGGQGGYNRPSGGQGGQGGYNRPSGGQGGYNRPGGGQGGQGGYNRPSGGQGGFNRPGGGQGGFNRPGGGQGGFNRGGGQGGFGSSMSSGPVEENKKTPVKKTFKAKKQVYSRKDREDADTVDRLLNQKKKQTIRANPVPKEIEIMDTISVSELAKKMNLKASEIISKLMGMGMMVSITQTIDADTATLVADEFDCKVKIISLYDETVIASEADIEADMISRPPVVTIMGHVDHGKTKTLDAIRSANVAASEFGGITQHIGAYMVETPKGRITFLDTPGHEAFTMMRARGAKVTDIVVLVVAADDGVMPQTIEAINHAKDAKVPIIVAVNKIDKPEANPDKVKSQLSDLGLTPEDWGGQTQYVHISALKKEGLDKLLDAILLQSEILELKVNTQCRAEGKVIESRIDHGRGVVCTVIIERGTLRIGDPYVGGIYAGHVRSIYNDCGKKLLEATPAMPVEIVGFEGMPNAGDPFQVTESDRDARDISAKRQELKRFEDSKSVKKVTLDNLYDTITDGDMLELKVVIKADVQGSAEALKQSLEKLSTKDIRLNVIHSSAGAINESDVMLATADSNAIIIGFNVRPTPKAKALADQEKVDIRKYNVIYKAVEEITAAMEGMLKPDEKEEVVGTIEVRDTFKVPKIGLISGCYVLTGLIKRSHSVNVIRDGIVIFTGKLSSLKRFKDDVKEVAAGYECGIGLVNWQDVKVGDQFEVFEMVEVARKLNGPSDNTEKAKE